jgi:hypothetical protein
MRKAKALSILVAAALAVGHSSLAAEAFAGGRHAIRLAEMEMGDGGGRSVDLVVWKVTVTPVRAHVGDVIDVDVWIDNREDGSDTTWAQLYAGKKVVAKQMFRWGTPGMDRAIRLSMKWDTAGMAPGEYRVKVEAYVPEDNSPFDNDLAAPQPVILVAPGEGFPGGAQQGGSATEIDPRYK